MRFDITVYHYSNAPDRWVYEVGIFDVKDPVRIFRDKAACGQEESLDAVLNAAKKAIGNAKKR